MRLIALTGPKGTGKSALASIFANNRGFRRLSFAEPIRAMLAAGLGVHCNNMTTGEKETVIPWLDATPRKLMQTLGTEWGRHLVIHDIWIRVMERSLQDAERAGVQVVIDDVRFENEAQLVHKFGGKVHMIRREGVDQASDHVSEKLLGPEFCEGPFWLENQPDGKRLTSHLITVVDILLANCL